MDETTTRGATEPALLQLVEQTLHDLRAGAPGRVRATLASRLDDDLQLDSLARMELVLRIERTFAVDLPEDTLQTAATVGDLLKAVQRASPHGAAQPPGFATSLDEEVTSRNAAPAQPDAVLANATTLLDALAARALASPGRTQIVCLGDGAARAITCRQLAEGAAAIAAGLQRAGLRPRESVAIMLPTSPEYFFVFLGILTAGGVPVPVYPPTRVAQLAEHVARHRRILASAQAAMLVTVAQAAPVARLLRARVPSLREVLTPAALALPGAQPTPVAITGADIALIQYTSGSTGQPKGVVLAHANLLANLRAMKDAICATPGDVFVSWLPLYHDMGLIGAFLGSLCVGFPLVVMSPLAFLAKPERWLWAMHRYRGTLSAGPNFSYELCLRKLDDAALAGLDLSAWRVAFNGAEPVNPDTVQGFQQRFARYGLRPEAMAPVYGLAEGALGLLFPPLGRGPVIDRIERETFARSGRALPAAPEDSGAQRFVSCGRPLAGHEVRIVDEHGRDVGDRVEGRLEFRGPSATAGYFRDPEETARLFHGDWLDTGDRAYRAGGEIYLTGRVKDIVIRGGRNLYPHEIEAAVADVAGVRRGCVAVFGEPDAATGTERLIVLAETRADDAPARDAVRAAIAHAVSEAIGEPPDEIVLVPAHAVLKTSSGKVRRAACRALYREGRIGAAATLPIAQALRLAASAFVARLRDAPAAAAGLAFGLYALLVFGLVFVPTWFATLFAPTHPAAWRIGHRAMRLVLRLTGTSLRVLGLEHLPREGTCVLVSNHASYVDGMVLLAALPSPFTFVVKRELARQPVVGSYLRRLGVAFVERYDIRRSVDDARRLAEAVTQGRSLLVFPEGTFSSGPALLPFRLGGFLAAASAGAPVVPVAIRGSRELLPETTWLPRRGALTVCIGVPVSGALAGPDEVFAAAVRLRKGARDSIEKALSETAA